MNAAVRLLAGVGVASFLVIGLAVIAAYEVSVDNVAAGNVDAFRQFVVVGVLAVLAIVILPVVTRVR
ncbi:hypothetical protein [Natrarchaeobaculum sulfurireducens]|uniref:hypothetical protein n=1 Tax=Natrarchaeobaculum sulfurireducens TaxID=2044521 RepID=UPI00105AB0C3|nr:hypothetical protein [Natrarchaeobaculum sulfurireducens]